MVNWLVRTCLTPISIDLMVFNGVAAASTPAPTWRFPNQWFSHFDGITLLVIECEHTMRPQHARLSARIATDTYRQLLHAIIFQFSIYCWKRQSINFHNNQIPLAWRTAFGEWSGNLMNLLDELRFPSMTLIKLMPLQVSTSANAQWWIAVEFMSHRIDSNATLNILTATNYYFY